MLRRKRKTVRTILREISAVQESVSFISSRVLENGNLQYIQGQLNVSKNANGQLSIYGQISDLSKKKARELLFKNLAEDFRSSLEISRRMVFRYQVGTRRAVFLQ